MDFDFFLILGARNAKKSAPSKASALLRTCDVLEGAEVVGNFSATALPHALFFELQATAAPATSGLGASFPAGGQARGLCLRLFLLWRHLWQGGRPLTPFPDSFPAPSAFLSLARGISRTSAWSQRGTLGDTARQRHKSVFASCQAGMRHFCSLRQ